MADINEMITTVGNTVRGYLSKAYPDFGEYGNGSFTLQEGSAIVSIQVREWHEGDVAVEFTSQLVSGADVTPGLMEWLLRKNSELHFGAFGLLYDNTIMYAQTVPGGDLTLAEFVATVRTVAVIADHYDDEIIEKYGGTLVSEQDAQ